MARPEIPSWASMPHKMQLLVLFLSRFADFFQMACLQAVMFHQLRSFEPSATDSEVSWQAGILTGVFTSAQIVTGLLWGRIADYPRIGRKRVLLVGFLGTAISCIGIAFAGTFETTVAWRCLGGAVNGTVGAARTMLAESLPIPYHSRAFLILPLAFNVAQMFGPILGGWLADPWKNHAEIFGPGTIIGGSSGLIWMKKYPFAPPNLLSAGVCILQAAVIYLIAFETLPSRRHQRDRGRELGQTLYSICGCSSSNQDPYSIEVEIESDTNQVEMQGLLTKVAEPLDFPAVPFFQIFTRNVIVTLISIALFDFHMGAFSSLWLVFLSTARSKSDPKSFFYFTGGLSFPPPTVGWAMSILGFIGILLQLILYPRISSQLGLVRSFRYSLLLFPMAYFITPFLVYIPSESSPPDPVSGIRIWMGIATVLLLQVAARTFALPASILLLNNSSPHPSVLATTHGLGSSTSALFRTIGPMIAGHWYATGIHFGMIGWAWWMVALVSACGVLASIWVRNGKGHDILLKGDMGSSPMLVKPRAGD